MAKIVRIDFQENWNNKLINDIFSSIRPITKKYDITSRYAIYLRDRFFCYADIVAVDQLSIEEIISRKLHFLDTGKSDQDFIELMESFYGKKTWWKSKETTMTVVYFKKIIQTDLFNQI